MAELHLTPIPALSDNYIWLLADANGNAVIVDPGDAEPARRALREHGLRLRAIILTHHHPDHTAGVGELVDQGVSVYAPLDERIAHATHRVADGDLVELAAPAVSLRVIAVPGHTRSHVSYVGEGMLFCGDTLFSLGCGRLFEGTPEQMLASLDRLAALPGTTRVCCGHEYTAANGAFALDVDPANAALRERLAEVHALRADGRPSLPSTLASELDCNPFLRIDCTALRQRFDADLADPDDRIQRFARLRAAKDQWRA